MAFSPYSTPVQYEYKPLNLSAFMIPLAKMQEQFDTTEAAVKGSTVTIANLPYGTDPKKAEELINTYNEKRDELAKNLIESKNYKQAAIKLKELNTTWLKDPEKAGLESNYAIYKDMLKTADENVKSGYWSQQRANQWLERSRREYKGAEFKADYENPTGKYTTYGRTARVKDLEKEREELAWKIASAIPAQKGDAFRAAGIDVELMDKKFVKTITEEKDANVIAQRVSEYLKTLPRFKEEAIEVADYNFADLTQNPERAQEYQEVAADLNDKYLNGVNYQLARLEKEAEKDKNILKSTEYKDLLAEKENAVKAKTTGEYDPTATKNLFVNQHLNDVYDMGALGKVLAYKNVTHEYTFRDIPKPTGPGEGGDGTGLALGKDAFFHPETDVTYHIPAFQKQMQTAAQGLFPVLRQLNSFGKGNVRTAIYSNLSAEDKEAMAKNPAIGIARNKNLLTAFATSKDLKSFMSNAGAKGIKMTKENASTIFKYFSAPNGTGIKQFKEILESAAPYEQAFNSASTNLKNVRAEVQGSTEYKSAINNLGNMSPAILVNRDQMVSAPKALQAVYRNQIALFNGTTYSPEQLKRAGISIPAGRTFHQLTFNDVSKLAGFKNVNDAIKKGFKFGNVPITGGAVGNQLLGKNITDYLSKLENKLTTNMTSEKQSFNLLNTPAVSKDLSRMVTTVGELLQHSPAYSTNFSNQPGFTAENTAKPGTKLVIDAAHPPVLQVHGNDLNYKYYYQYLDEDGKPQISSIVVKPKPGMDPRTEKFIDNALVTATGDDSASKGTKAMLLETKFNMVFGNNMNETSFEAIPVKEGQKKLLESIPSPYPGQNIVFMKEFDERSMKPVVRIYTKNASGISTAVNDETGRPKTCSSTSEAKRFIGEKLLDVEAQ